MVYVVEDIGIVRVKHAGVRDIFQGGGSVGSSLWVRDVGDDPLCGTGPGGFPAQGGPSDHRNTTEEALVHKLVVPPLEEAVQGVFLEEVEAYIPRRKNIDVQYIST